MTQGSPLRIGIIRLTDAAPLIIARECGYFAAEGLDVALSVEPSWANIADKLAFGLLDGAMLLPPLALALHFGLSGSAGPEKIIVPAALSLNGNTVTLSNRWIAAMTREDGAALGELSAVETARRFAAALRRSHEKPHLAAVHTFSTHNFLMRYWLATGGIDPDREASFTVVPPAQTVEAMQAGRIDGFCAGAPWGEVAARAGIGRAVATSHAIWNNGVEKVFAVRQTLAEESPNRLQAALRAVLRAGRFCDAPANARHVAELLARPEYLDLPAEIIQTSLPCEAPGGRRTRSPDADVSVFFANAANFPWRSHAQWFLREMRRWGYLGAVADLDRAVGIFRPELYAEAARSVGLAVPASQVKSEGRHAGPWLLPALPAPIAMGPDRFLDGASFDPLA